MKKILEVGGPNGVLMVVIEIVKCSNMPLFNMYKCLCVLYI
jgi:hypothetical protein